jgi:acetate kinase
VRAGALRELGFLGIEVDEARNAEAVASGDCDVATPASRVRVLVVPAREDWAIARSATRLLAGAAGHTAGLTGAAAS